MLEALRRALDAGRLGRRLPGPHEREPRALAPDTRTGAGTDMQAGELTRPQGDLGRGERRRLPHAPGLQVKQMERDGWVLKLAPDRAAVAPRGENREDDDQRERPENRQPDVVARGRADEESAGRVDMIVIGLCSANFCGQVGIEATGTNAEDAKVSGRMIMKP